MKIVLILFLCICIGIIYIYAENKALTFTCFSVKSRKIPKGFDGVKLVLLTDLHCNIYGRKNRRLLRQIDKQNPDYIMVAGDLVHSGDEGKTHIALEFMVELSKRYQIIYAYGNHESRLEEREESQVFVDYVDSLKKSGVIILDNASIKLEKNGDKVLVYGLTLPLIYYQEYKTMRYAFEDTENLLGKSDENMYNIMLAHMPNYFEQYVEWGADLVLSGHIHGGVMILPFVGGVISPFYELFPKYDYGLFEYKDSTMFLSKGLGTHTIPVRIFNRPEFLCIDLIKDE